MDPPLPRPLVILPPPPDDDDDEEEDDGPLVPLPRVLRNASVRSEVNWVSRKSSRYFILCSNSNIMFDLIFGDVDSDYIISCESFQVGIFGVNRRNLNDDGLV